MEGVKKDTFLIAWQQTGIEKEGKGETMRKNHQK